MDIDVSTEEPPAQSAQNPSPPPAAPADASPPDASPPDASPPDASLADPSPPGPSPTDAARAAAAPPEASVAKPRSSSADGPALLIIGLIVAAAIAVFVASQASSWFSPRPSADAYSVQPYTPPAQLISAGDHVLAHARPDLTSPTVVMFGPGVGLTITGRVSRGFGGEWYAITWNGRTAFIRQQDATPGTATAPPPTAPHVAAPPHEEEKPDVDEGTGFPDLETPAPQTSGPVDLSNVRWASRPGRRDFERAYPERALYASQSGHVTLDCVASGSGALDCSVAVELPRGYGFGRAAMDLSRQFRLQPTTADGHSVAGGHIQVPIEFRAN